MRKRPIQAAFETDLEEEEQRQDDQLQRLKNVFQRYRDAKCPVKKAHPQSVTSLARMQSERMLQVLDKYGDDATIEGMERFCNERFWLEKGLPLNAFYKFQDRWIEDSNSGAEEPEDTGAGRSSYQRTDAVQKYSDLSEGVVKISQPNILRQQLIGQIQLAIGIAIRRGDKDSESYFLRMGEEIKPKDAPQELINEVERKVKEYTNV